MNIQLGKKIEPETKVEKGDILVFSHKFDDKFSNYLVVEDCPRNEFVLINLNGNNVISTIAARTVNELHKKVIRKFEARLTLVEVINHNDIVIKRTN